MATKDELDHQEIQLQHELAIWELLYAYLDDDFIKKDGRDIKMIKVLDCKEPVVMEDTIDQVLQGLAEGPIKSLRSRLEALKKSELVTKGGTDVKQEKN